MTVAVAEQTRGYNPADATVYAVGSNTPPASSFLVLFTATRHATTAPASTPVNAYGGTWVELIGEQVDGITAIGAWGLQCSASPGTAGFNVNIDGGITAIGFSHSLLACTGHDPSGTVVQAVVGPTGTTSGTSSITFPSLGSATDALLTYHIHRGNTASTSEAGWTGGTSHQDTGPNHGGRAEWRTDRSDLTATMTFTSVRWQTIGVQIKELVSGVAPKLYVPLVRRNHLGQMTGRA